MLAVQRFHFVEKGQDVIEVVGIAQDADEPGEGHRANRRVGQGQGVTAGLGDQGAAAFGVADLEAVAADGGGHQRLQGTGGEGFEKVEEALNQGAGLGHVAQGDALLGDGEEDFEERDGVHVADDAGAGLAFAGLVFEVGLDAFDGGADDLAVEDFGERV